MNARALMTALILAPLLAAGCQPAPTPTATPSPAPTQAPTAVPSPTPASEGERVSQGVDGVMGDFMRDHRSTACSVAVVSPGDGDALQRQVFNYGALSLVSQTKVDENTEYEIGSLTKLFTGNLLAFFVSDGQVKLEDPLQMYLPEDVKAPSYLEYPVTLLHLATHTSGLPRRAQSIHGTRKIEGVPVSGYATDEEVYRAMTMVHLKTYPGSEWEYSNLGYGLLGIALGRMADENYGSMVKFNILADLNMSDTAITLSPDQKQRLAQGYTAAGDNAPAFATEGGLLAAGGYRSTIADLATYLEANLAPPPSALGGALQLSQQSFEDGPARDTGQALGWLVARPHTPEAVLIKAGATAGFSAYIALSPQKKSGFVVVCNGPSVSSVAPALAELVGLPAGPIDNREDAP